MDGELLHHLDQGVHQSGVGYQRYLAIRIEASKCQFFACWAALRAPRQIVRVEIQ